MYRNERIVNEKYGLHILEGCWKHFGVSIFASYDKVKKCIACEGQTPHVRLAS